MIKIVFTILMTCFLNSSKACEGLFVTQSDTLNRYQFVNAYKQTLGKPIQKNKSVRSCPVCHRNTDVIPVIYGYPTIEMARQSGKGEIIIGGCIPDKKRTNYCRKDKRYF